jgi:hypothetical protein
MIHPLEIRLGFVFFADAAHNLSPFLSAPTGG